MNQHTPNLHARRLRRALAPLSLAVSAALCATSAQAEILDLYFGAGLGQSQVRGEVPNVASFKENHSAWKAFAGVRVISLLGAEVGYIDLGSPSGTIGGQTVRADLDGKYIAGLVYLPIPAPFIDVYGKAGYTHLTGELSASTSPPLRASLDDDVFTAGVGVQFRFAGWGVRGEYERFTASGEDPAVWTVSLTKHFF